jgi:hypothetical protein
MFKGKAKHSVKQVSEGSEFFSANISCISQALLCVDWMII